MAFTNCVGGTAKLNTGFSIPLIGLGTYKIVGRDAVTMAVDAALKAGYRLFDTAKYYVNESELGIALQELLPKYNLKREEIFITTKFSLAEKNNSEHTRKMIDESLKNLRTEYLDLVLIHYPKADAYSSLARNHPDLMSDSTIAETAKAHNSTPQLVLLAWALSFGIGIIPKSANPERVIDNFKVVGMKLTKEEIERITELNRNKNYIRCDGWNVD
uniref:NADP-dependent oxidoreductase domain-containing protein n=1 Tax=Wuchereria bancrofti TaxID=6293 RepID=A0A1I8EPP2_WUCBA